ncbi:MAG: hypothetical protein K0Q82_1090 [Chryseobacterium indoltheticum]|jgi:hypothetical protein|nr:hypothetical protein [Chryseobacterium indoltheticum]
MPLIDKSKYSEMKEKKINLITLFLITISSFLLIYILIYILNYYSNNGILLSYPSEFNYQNKLLTPNEIGDSIGGILNPIIGFTAAILTFLAFYMQYEANKDQRSIYFKNIRREDNDKVEEHRVNLRIFKNLVISMLDFYNSSGESIKKFVDEEIQSPLSMNIPKFTTNNSYEIFKSLDFKQIYASVVYNFKNSEDDWEEEFIEVLVILDFYEKLIADIKENFKIQNQKKYSLIAEVGDNINLQMNDIFPNDIVNNLDGLIDYMAIIYNKNPDNTSVIPDAEFSFPDINKLYSIFFPKFITALLAEYRKNDENQNEYKRFLDIFNHYYKKLGGEKAQAENYARDLSENYFLYFADNTNVNKILEFLAKIIYYERNMDNTDC